MASVNSSLGKGSLSVNTHHWLAWSHFAAPLPPALPTASDADCDATEGNVVYIDCPYESILMEHCFRCFNPDTPSGEMVVCDGWSEDNVRAQCHSAVPLWAPILTGGQEG